ncbi:hypothetical protein [Streptomyces sp. ODS05-4]|uniref:hypothetical protein n=1 Tax=Streptomyces sp. ODS05-4 TaxID=2944939 RepID=UPI0021095CD7|nr:hypothetical protein [Streptomyces sp. ODS05-4]
MSFGDPNNPYGQPQGQPQQPGYGYPQGQPQQQPGYGYPAAPPAPAYGGGYPGGPVEMPGGVKAARVMLIILGSFQAIGALVFIVAAGWIADMISEAADSSSGVSSSDADAAASFGAGVAIVIGVILIGFALWAILTGAKMAKGGNGLRVSGIVYASLITLLSLLNLLGANFFALISLVLGILIIVFLARGEASAYFNRPRY